MRRYDVSDEADDRAETLFGTVVFYGLMALVICALGFLAYYAPDAKSGVSDTPEAVHGPADAVVDGKTRFDLPSADSWASSVAHMRKIDRRVSDVR